MTLHYHATPINPRSAMDQLAGRCFCVSYSDPRAIEYAHQIGQSVLLDNGAYAAWTYGRSVDWRRYYAWAEPWLDYATSWAIIPDVIDGDPAANDALIEQWPHGHRGAPVWHLHEPASRLLTLAERWPRVCLGSSGDYRDVGSARWHHRMIEVMNLLCGNGPPPCWLHMLRGMNVCSIYPFASVDSSDIARNHHRQPGSAGKRATMWDAQQCPARWTIRSEQQALFEETTDGQSQTQMETQ